MRLRILAALVGLALALGGAGAASAAVGDGEEDGAGGYDGMGGCYEDISPPSTGDGGLVEDW